jgi:hypothetical protein
MCLKTWCLSPGLGVIDNERDSENTMSDLPLLVTHISSMSGMLQHDFSGDSSRMPFSGIGRGLKPELETTKLVRKSLLIVQVQVLPFQYFDIHRQGARSGVVWHLSLRKRYHTLGDLP